MASWSWDPFSTALMAVVAIGISLAPGQSVSPALTFDGGLASSAGAVPVLIVALLAFSIRQAAGEVRQPVTTPR